MSDDREQFNVRLPAEVADRFRAFVKEVEGKNEGTLGEHVETALLEYMDRGRDTRIEEKIDANRELIEQLQQTLSEETGHTHTPESGFSEPDTSGSPTVERTRKIAERLQSQAEIGVENEQVERAIVDLAGGHDQTVRKYKTELRRRGLLFEHPNDDSPMWYLEREPWFNAVKSYALETPDPEGTVSKVVDEYPVKTRQIADDLEVVSE
jgi:hypothetical protein